MVEDKVWYYFKTEGQPAVSSVRIKSGADVEVDYGYAGEGKPYISYFTVEGDKVKHLREAIWEKSKEALKVFQNIKVSEDLELWKEGGEKSLELNRVLTGGDDPVFKDGEKKKVSVTPAGAGSADGSFTNAAHGGEKGQSARLARELLVPFHPIPTTVEEIKSALVARPLRKIPVHKNAYDLLQDGTAMASELFERNTSASWADFVSAPVTNAVYFCLQCGGIEQRDSSASRQTIWDSVFYVIWRALLYQAGVGDVTITRDLGSTFASSTRSDLSLKSYGKEVCYVDEHSGLVRASEQQLSKKFKGYLDSRLFGDMKYMIGVATDGPRYHVVALRDDERHSLLPAMNVFQSTGILHALLICINLLRMAVTWAPVFRDTPGMKELVPELSFVHGTDSQIKRIIRGYKRGVKKTIQPWREHVAECFTELEYVEKAYSAIGPLTRAMPTVGDRDKYSVMLAVQGEHRLPRSCEELRACVIGVLKLLSKLHTLGIVHRDIRWGNILFAENAWILIDYETVWEADDVPLCYLRVFSEDIFDEDGVTYSKKSDLKLVAKLFDDKDLKLCCEDLEEDFLEDFRNQLLHGFFNDGAAALAALS